MPQNEFLISLRQRLGLESNERLAAQAQAASAEQAAAQRALTERMGLAQMDLTRDSHALERERLAQQASQFAQSQALASQGLGLQALGLTANNLARPVSPLQVVGQATSQLEGGPSPQAFMFGNTALVPTTPEERTAFQLKAQDAQASQAFRTKLAQAQQFAALLPPRDRTEAIHTFVTGKSMRDATMDQGFLH